CTSTPTSARSTCTAADRTPARRWPAGCATSWDRDRSASGHAELVALRVGHRDPVVRALLPVVQPRGAAPGQPFDDRLGSLVADPDVEVDPVLDGLPLGDQLEEDAPLRGGSLVVGMADRAALPPDQRAVVPGRVGLGGVALVDHAPDECLVGRLD